jgi:hypothetical protein
MARRVTKYKAAFDAGWFYALGAITWIGADRPSSFWMGVGLMLVLWFSMFAGIALYERVWPSKEVPE